MQFTYESIVAALESAQGGTFYALLVLLLLSVASLILQARARPAKLDPRVSLGLGILMGLRLVEVLVFAWAWLGTASVATIGAPLERGIHLVTLVTLGWIWSRSDGEGRFRQGLFGTALVAALVIASSLIAIWLNAPIRATFNYTNFDYIWTSASLFALILGFSQLLSAAKPARGLGFLSLGLLFVGQLVHLFLAEPFGSMPLAAQAAYLLSLPLLFLLPVSSKKEIEVGEVTKDAASQSSAPTSPAPDAGLPSFFDFDAVEGTPSPIGSPEELARETAEKFGADLCLLVRLVGDELQLVYGYNLLRSTSIETGSLPALEVPTLVSAIRIGQPLRLSAEERLPDLTSLSKTLSLSFTSHLLAVPFSPSSGTREWAMLLLDLEHEWQLEDEVALEREINQLTGDLAQMLGSELAESISQPAGGANKAYPDLEELEAENARFRQDIEQLIVHIDQLKFSQPASNGQAAVQSNEVVQALQMENERLKNSLASLEASPTPPSQPSSLEAKQAKEELRLALEEVASLHIRLDAAQQGVLEAGVGAPTTKKMAASQTELIASIAQELRQPLSSILGYTDLLLGESVGILGALQRKFLERVRNSTERMNTLIDNLIRIAELDQGGYSATRKAVDLSAVMDDAIGQLRTQLQEKRIALRVDLPPQLPEINTDRDALQQILYHLLQNADAATPAKGSITLRAFMDSQSELGEFVLIQVSDTGGGIPEEDLPRVFSRVYRASNPVIPGVGDTGVGLTIAETLTQALGGRIWVESEAGVGATFSVLLPLQPAS